MMPSHPYTNSYFASSSASSTHSSSHSHPHLARLQPSIGSAKGKARALDPHHFAAARNFTPRLSVTAETTDPVLAQVQRSSNASMHSRKQHTAADAGHAHLARKHDKRGRNKLRARGRSITKHDLSQSYSASSSPSSSPSPSPSPSPCPSPSCSPAPVPAPVQLRTTLSTKPSTSIATPYLSMLGQPTVASASLSTPAAAKCLPSLYQASRGRSTNVNPSHSWDRRCTSAIVLSGSEDETIRRPRTRSREHERRANASLSRSPTEQALFAGDDQDDDGGVSSSSDFDDDDTLYASHQGRTRARRWSSVERGRRRGLRILLASEEQQERQQQSSERGGRELNRRSRRPSASSEPSDCPSDLDAMTLSSCCSTASTSSRSRSSSRSSSEIIRRAKSHTIIPDTRDPKAGACRPIIAVPVSSDADPLLSLSATSIEDMIHVDAVEFSPETATADSPPRSNRGSSSGGGKLSWIISDLDDVRQNYLPSSWRSLVRLPAILPGLSARRNPSIQGRGVATPIEGDRDPSAYVSGLGQPIDPDTELSSVVQLQTFRRHRPKVDAPFPADFDSDRPARRPRRPSPVRRRSQAVGLFSSSRTRSSDQSGSDLRGRHGMVKVVASSIGQTQTVRRPPPGSHRLLSNSAHLRMLSLELEMIKNNKISSPLKPRWGVHRANDFRLAASRLRHAWTSSSSSDL